MARSKKKKQPLPPRRKRLTRAGRLPSAQAQRASFEGKNVVRGYAKWFGVDLLCAARELALLGVKLDASYLESLRVTVQNRRRKKQPTAVDDSASDFGQSGEHFSFIVGHTSGGMPSGVPWPDDDLESESPES